MFRPLTIAIGLVLALQGSSVIKCDTSIPIESFVKHKNARDIWISIDNKVYDVSEFLKSHPGGAEAILKYGGRDATKAFKKQHIAAILNTLPKSAYKGVLEGTLEEDLSEEELLLEEMKKRKPALSHIFNANDFESVAKKILPKDIYTYFATGSDDEATLRECAMAYSRVFFRPRVLQHVENVDLSTNMLGCSTDFPFYITSFAGQAQLHPEGEKVLARVADRNNIMFIIPRLATKPIPEILNEIDPQTSVWWQMSANHGDPKLEKAFAEVAKYDQIKGIFISTDSAVGGNREKDFKVRQQVTNATSELSGYAAIDKTYPSITWDDIKRYKSLTDKKIILKGIQCTEDVLKALELGLDGVVLSNHGGRQLDYSQPPLEVLVESMPILRQQPYYNKDKFQVFIDGGIRRGTDIVKAIALGASGVGMGKAFAFPLATYGEEGAQRLVDLLKMELNRDLKLLGVSQISQLNESYVNTKGLYNRIGNYADSYFRNYEKLPAPVFIK